MKAIAVSTSIVSLSEFKNKASRMLNDVRASRRPLILTQNGRAAGVLISPADYDFLTEQARFAEAVQRGMADVQEGRMVADEALGDEL